MSYYYLFVEKPRLLRHGSGSVSYYLFIRKAQIAPTRLQISVLPPTTYLFIRQVQIAPTRLRLRATTTFLFIRQAQIAPTRLQISVLLLSICSLDKSRLLRHGSGSVLLLPFLLVRQVRLRTTPGFKFNQLSYQCFQISQLFKNVKLILPKKIHRWQRHNYTFREIKGIRIRFISNWRIQIRNKFTPKTTMTKRFLSLTWDFKYSTVSPADPCESWKGFEPGTAVGAVECADYHLKPSQL